ncbi:hypothetical protein BRI6_2890 [plant metagenome]|uniref:Uncharacterized protein n=1 Tax=plant metagenome TaxID=1297885 RepID=A0A484YU15_9ZZZZ
MLQGGVDDTAPGTGQCRQYVGGGGWGKIHGQGARIPLALAAPGRPLPGRACRLGGKRGAFEKSHALRLRV